MRVLVVLCAALWALPVWARPRLDPRVRLLARGLLPATEFAPEIARPPGRLPLRVAVPGGAAALARAGLPARALSADVAALDLPAGALPQLLALPGLLAVEPGRRLRPQLDESVPLVRGDAARVALGLDGRGVLIAVVDTGLDVRHPDFRHPDGRTRVRWLLDAAAPRGGRHPELPDYGGMAVYSAEDLDALLRAEAEGREPPLPFTQRDLRGHGTHVAGIAAGSGRATGRGLPGGRYVGLAPGADLCAVQASRDGREINDDDVVIGVRFCLDRAREAGQPVVVNLSLGGLGGPHDGTTVLERALDQLFPDDEPGRALVVSAGNAGNRDWHAGAYLLRGEATVTVRLATLAGARRRGTSEATLEVYWDGELALTVLSPKGEVVGPAHPGAPVRGEVGEEGRVTIESEVVDGRHRAVVVLAGADSEKAPTGDWRLVLAGQARRWDAWVADATDDLSLRLLGHLDADTQIELPATARQALSVGAFVSRTGWTRSDGMRSERTREERLAPSLFSAAGPTADGRFAPDLSAPGEFIVSALAATAPLSDPRSSFHYPPDPAYLSADDGVHAVLRGTSQAAPHVAGAVALLFQLEPRLTLPRLRELLRTTAEGTAYGPRQGFGRLDVLRAARALRGERPGPLDPGRSLVGVSRDLVPPGDLTVVTAVPRDGEGLPLGPGLPVAMDTTAGEWAGPVRDLGNGRYERLLRAQGPRGTVALVQVRVGETPLGARLPVLFAAGRDELRPPATTGCAAAWGGAPAPLPLFVLAAALLGLGRARPRLRRRDRQALLHRYDD